MTISASFQPHTFAVATFPLLRSLSSAVTSLSPILSSRLFASAERLSLASAVSMDVLSHERSESLGNMLMVSLRP